MFAVNSWKFAPGMSADSIYNIRDFQMSDNLQWLAKKKYPDKKIIVWAHNSHIAMHPSEIQPPLGVSMGDVFSKSTNEEIYVMGFNSYDGIYGRILYKTKLRIENPAVNSFEKWAKSTGFEYAFINWKNDASKDQVFPMKGVRHRTESAPWSKIYDGIFYVEKMFPCDEVK
jgi:erythromycin esterase